MARGGKRYPKEPAPVSGPGALSRRTDGGPGSKTQPIRVPTGGTYGSAQALQQAQQGAPLPDRTAGMPAPDSGGPVAPAPMPHPGGVFGPTDRPYEPATAGLRSAQSLPYDPDMALRALYSVFPHPQLLALMRR